LKALQRSIGVDEVRFEMAKELLLKPGVRINEVALSIGFDDQSNFTRMLRRISGFSPKEFLKTARNQTDESQA